MCENNESEVLFLSIENQTDTDKENSNIEGEVDLEARLISALEELRRYKNKNKSLEKQLLEYEEELRSRKEEVSNNMKETKQTIIDLKTQLRESKISEDIIRKQLNEKQYEYENLEDEIIHLRKKLENGTIQSRLENNSKMLDDILNNQKPSRNKIGLGKYDQNKVKEGCNPSIQKIDKNPKGHADAL